MKWTQNTITDLDEIVGPEPSHPEEAALGGRTPHAGEEVEDIGSGSDPLDPEELVVMGDVTIHDHF